MDSNTRYGLWIECVTTRYETYLKNNEESAIDSDINTTTNNYLVPVKNFDCTLYNKGWWVLMLMKRELLTLSN